MTSTIPRVSIGMPVYNAEAYIREAVEALLAQTYTDFEIIISDNASVDKTEAICRSYVAQDPRIRYERLNDNVGAIGNFNRVFLSARGEYFKWAAYDDVCQPTYLQRCVDVLDRDKSVIWCHTQTGKIDANGRVLTRDDPLAEGRSHTSHAGMPRAAHRSHRRHERFRGVLLGTSWCVDSYGLIRSEAIRSTRLYPSCYGSEKVLMGALSLLGHYREIPETLFHQRVHPKASSSLDSAADQMAFMDTKAPCQFSATRLRLLKGHFDVVCYTKMSPLDRARCLVVIGQYLLQIGKWERIITNMLTGTGIGRSRKQVAACRQG